MTVAQRSYNVGFEVIDVLENRVGIRNYSVIDGVKTIDPNVIWLRKEDGVEYSYTKTVNFEDWIDVGDNKILNKRRIDLNI